MIYKQKETLLQMHVGGRIHRSTIAIWDTRYFCKMFLFVSCISPLINKSFITIKGQMSRRENLIASNYMLEKCLQRIGNTSSQLQILVSGASRNKEKTAETKNKRWCTLLENIFGQFRAFESGQSSQHLKREHDDSLLESSKLRKIPTRFPNHKK